MDVRRCACGCGLALNNPTNSQKYYNLSHKRRHYYRLKKNIPVESEKPKKKINRTPEQRWRNMSLEDITAEGLRLHKTYGQLQSMYYNGILPDDFGR